jgi:HipA-like protein
MYESTIELSYAAEKPMPIYGNLHKVQTTFSLMYKNLEIGVLTFNNFNWTFEYSNGFINQNTIKPITGFPNIHKVYQSPNLFPFFDFRIPSLKRPEIQDIIKKEKLDATNKADLLAYFGKKTITNPYVLTVID